MGCGIAGIAAAAALRAHFREVVVLERDRLPAEPAARRGVPQSDQLHNLLGCAQVHLEWLLPGFCDALLAAGGRSARVADETHVWELGTRMPERDLGLRLMCAWRPVIDHVARTVLLRGDDGARIVIRESTHAAGLRLSPSGAVAGVKVEAAGVASVIPAAIVVDASGATSKAAQWLATAGREVPEVITAQSDQWYVTTLFSGAERADDSAFWLTFPTPPRSRGGLVSPVDGGRWYVSLSGRSGDRPPTSPEEVRAFARTLEDPAIGSLLESASAVSPPRLFRKAVATWRRYECLPRPLPGFLPIGDCVASLNPLFGQGMSVAAWQARELASLLARLGPEPEARAELTSQYLARAAAAVDAAWSLGQMADGALGPVNRRQAVTRLVRDDPEFHALYVRIWHLLAPASLLDRPDVRSQIERADSRVAKAV